MSELTPELLLAAYANGYFPMAEERHGTELFWFSPEERGVLPLETFHLPHALRKFLRHCPYRITADTDFPAVIRACADTPRRHESGTWINDRIIDLYSEVFRLGHAHSVECWQGETLIGGLYGLSLGGAFFGESMFSLVPNASKVALVALAAILRAAEYRLLDTQYVNPHLQQFGCISMAKQDYLAALENALNVSSNPSSRFLSVAGTILSAPSFPASLILPFEASRRS